MLSVETVLSGVMFGSLSQFSCVDQLCRLKYIAD